MEAIAALNTIAFDKTGTLTKGRPAVTEMMTIGETTEGELLTLAASVESRSEHHLAAAITAEAAERGLTLVEPEQFSARAGRGIEATVAGQVVLAGNLEFLAEQGIDTSGPLRDFRERVQTATIVGMCARACRLVRLRWPTSCDPRPPRRFDG